MIYSYMNRKNFQGLPKLWQEENAMKETYHVLVVEDDEQIRDGIEIYLKRED